MTVSAEYIDIGSFIDQREGYRGGRPFIVGTGVTVDRISVLHRIDGMSPEQIGEEMNLTPPQVMAALTFYFANKEAIDAEIDQSDRELEDRRNSHEAENGSVWDRIEARSRQ
jgi:uncharacterized protein (DUF433 family)